MIDLKEKLNLKSHPARLYTPLPDGGVICHLSHRNCQIKPGSAGFCRVRQNEGGKLVTLNYGVSVQMTQEMIETEAVVHHSPGAPILSLGNVGCMLNCDFCHNWKTSQMRFVETKDIFHYTPQQVVDTALSKGIGVISWTYNDPVVWHEFVCDTSRLAKQAGLMTLYKSAFSIDPRAVDELHDVIDIFSLSLKSMSPEFYRKVAKGRLEPVLEGIKQVYRFKDRHLELSNLIVTGMNDTLVDVDKVIDWMLKELDDQVPLHFVRFHPDYKYTHVQRTPIEFLKKARQRALDRGLKHVYLGNVYEEHEGLNTYCGSCKALLVKRFGLQTQLVGLDSDLRCKKCLTPGPIKVAPIQKRAVESSATLKFEKTSTFDWHGDINACHVLTENVGDKDETFLRLQNAPQEATSVALKPQEQWRFIASRKSNQDRGIVIRHPALVNIKFLEVLDRAHFPTLERSQEIQHASKN